MKKIAMLFMILAISVMMLGGCGEKNTQTVSQTVNVAALNGPTGMAMVQLTDMEDKYEVTTYQSPTDVTAKIINGDADVAAVPSNMAAVLYNKTEGDVVAISPIALGMLKILGNDADITDISQLKGRTIIASGQGGTPEYVLQKILEANGLKIYEDVNVEWLANHSEVNSKLLASADTIAMIPEPFVSTALAADKENVSVLFDLNQLWQDITGQELPMGVLVARKSFVEEREGDLEILLDDLNSSVDFVNDSPDDASKLIVEKGFIGDADIARQAIPGCHITLFTDDDTEEGIQMLKTFNQILFEMEPSSIGGKIPDEDMYYK